MTRYRIWHIVRAQSVGVAINNIIIVIIIRHHCRNEEPGKRKMVSSMGDERLALGAQVRHTGFVN